MTFQVTATVPVAEENEAVIVNDGWFPDVSLTTIRDLIRIDGTITSPRLRELTINAIYTVNSELVKWKQTKVANGHENLAAVPASTLDNISTNIQRYTLAVSCLTKANIIERYPDYDSSNEGNKRADDLEPSVGNLQRDARWAINDILGISRTTIELI
ncbi:hypothetical protein C3Y98_05355 [Methylotenera oryzisoli]|uniref:Head completion protein n=1 Tax=Methylotenera oryzisoli TaxID=2080758 RepID=A0A4Y9VR82_9PROT|nr:head completion/stabilization protein [Methylotenera oryzisoli]TFW71525.1 hypothetical protein C3Y98_05355 [Methylotenera oryzisoli]